MAHPARAEIVEQLSVFSDHDRYGPTTIPQFNSEMFQMLYGNQALLMLILLTQMRPLFVKVFDLDWDDAETILATSVVRILKEQKILMIDGE